MRGLLQVSLSKMCMQEKDGSDPHMRRQQLCETKRMLGRENDVTLCLLEEFGRIKGCCSEKPSSQL